MSKVCDTEVGVPETHVGGSGRVSPPGVGDSSKPPTLRGSNVDELST
jgi:hypothetical protein